MRQLTLRTSSRTAISLVVATLASALLVSCSEGAVEVTDARLFPDEVTLQVIVASCNKDPRVEVTETPSQVVLTASIPRSIGRSADACGDTVTVVLVDELTGRELVDGSTGETIDWVLLDQ